MINISNKINLVKLLEVVLKVHYNISMGINIIKNKLINNIKLNHYSKKIYQVKLSDHHLLKNYNKKYFVNNV
jgi:hypothetical protein